MKGVRSHVSAVTMTVEGYFPTRGFLSGFLDISCTQMTYQIFLGHRINAMPDTISRDNALLLSAMSGFTGVDRIYIGDYFSGILQLCMLMLLFFSDYLFIGEELVTLRVILFGLIAIWWAWDVINIGHMVAIPGNDVYMHPGQKWSTSEPNEEKATLVVALMFSLLVSIMPDWAPFHLGALQA